MYCWAYTVGAKSIKRSKTIRLSLPVPAGCSLYTPFVPDNHILYIGKIMRWCFLVKAFSRPMCIIKITVLSFEIEKAQIRSDLPSDTGTRRHRCRSCCSTLFGSLFCIPWYTGYCLQCHFMTQMKNKGERRTTKRGCYFSARMLCVTRLLASLILSVNRFDALLASLPAFSTQIDK